MSAEQKEIFELLSKLLEKGQWWQIGVIIAIINLPTLLAWFTSWTASRSLERVYAARLRDKDDEIERQAKTIKRFENELLKTKRP